MPYEKTLPHNEDLVFELGSEILLAIDDRIQKLKAITEYSTLGNRPEERNWYLRRMEYLHELKAKPGFLILWHKLLEDLFTEEAADESAR